MPNYNVRFDIADIRYIAFEKFCKKHNIEFSIQPLLQQCSVSCRTIMMLDDTVIVVDNSNYKAEYAEKVPFKAKVYCKDDKTITVVSLKTEKEYELYYNQVLEAMDIEDIVKLLDLSKYGS